MKCYEIPKTKCRMHIPVYAMGTKATRRKAAVHYASHSLSRGNLKNLMLRNFTSVCQLYYCSSKHNNDKTLRITFNSCKTVSTSSMALATVNIDKIIKVTSASSYVYHVAWVTGWSAKNGSYNAASGKAGHNVSCSVLQSQTYKQNSFLFIGLCLQLPFQCQNKLLLQHEFPMLLVSGKTNKSHFLCSTERPKKVSHYQ